jgi:hypothetical protein
MPRADYRMLLDGRPVPDDDSHKELLPDGKQKSYVVLTPEERHKGFLRHVRLDYRHTGYHVCGADLSDYRESELYGVGARSICHDVPGHAGEHGKTVYVATAKEMIRLKQTSYYKGCGKITKMSIEIAETFARDPWFYSGTFCCTCKAHFPLNQFVWLPEGDSMDPHLWPQAEINRIIERRKELGDLKETI